MFCAGVGASVTKGNQTIFLTYPLVSNSIEQQATEQQQDNTKATPKQHQDRATARPSAGNQLLHYLQELDC